MDRIIICALRRISCKMKAKKF